jgi:hypothetical protein
VAILTGNWQELGALVSADCLEVGDRNEGIESTKLGKIYPVMIANPSVQGIAVEGPRL